MNANLRYPQWQEPLATAMLELDPQRLIEKLQKTEKTITARILELRSDGSDETELRALYDGLFLIGSIRKELLDICA